MISVPSTGGVSVGISVFANRGTADFHTGFDSLDVGIEPVSYTHLDVYKRQIVILDSILFFDSYTLYIFYIRFSTAVQNREFGTAYLNQAVVYTLSLIHI